MALKHNFVVGDIVRLKTGGPNMTVDEVKDYSCMCVWFAPVPDERMWDGPWRTHFNHTVLEKVDP